MKIFLPEGRPQIEVPIEDGIAVISPVLRSDRRFFEQGLEMMSIESRFARFGQGLSHLSERELDYLTDVNQTTHVALGAAVDGEVAGVGRYIATGDGCPEVAITVLDDFQRRGIGPLLFSGLAAVARHDSLHELCFEASGDNKAIRKILAQYEVSPIDLDGSIDRRLRLSEVPVTPFDADFVDLIQAVRAKR